MYIQDEPKVPLCTPCVLCNDGSEINRIQQFINFTMEQFIAECLSIIFIPENYAPPRYGVKCF